MCNSIVDTFDVQSCIIEVDNISNVNIQCQFAQGSNVLGLYVRVEIENNMTISKNVSLSDNCRLFLENQKHTCVVNTTIRIAPLVVVGNYSVFIYDWEKNGSLNKVYQRDIQPKQVGKAIIFSSDTITSTTTMTEAFTTHTAAVHISSISISEQSG